MEWISVEDRLPKSNREYLVTYKIGKSRGVDVGVYSDNPNTIMWYPFLECDITHWMPLPNPPRRMNDDKR